MTILLSCQRVKDKSVSSSVDSLKTFSTIEKQKGAHVFAISDTTDYEFLHQINAEWITLVPWGFQEDYDTPSMMHYRGDSLELLRRDSSWIKRLNTIHSEGFKIFLKPHIWLDSPTQGKWRSDITPSNQDNWESWKKSYRNFILRYARLAEVADVEMFCVGMELEKLSTDRPQFWRKLIKEVRNIYSGKLTYAVNWHNEYEEIEFWDELDYIGVQAYFPLVDHLKPSVDDLVDGWKKYQSDLKAFAQKHNRQILFTEMGYKSTADSAVEPWRWIEDSDQDIEMLSLETQTHCYQAFFKAIWPQEWFAGVHLWQYNLYYETGYKSTTNQDFTPQGKPANEIIAQGFKKAD